MIGDSTSKFRLSSMDFGRGIVSSSSVLFAKIGGNLTDESKFLLKFGNKVAVSFELIKRISSK